MRRLVVLLEAGADPHAESLDAMLVGIERGQILAERLRYAIAPRPASASPDGRAFPCGGRGRSHGLGELANTTRSTPASRAPSQRLIAPAILALRISGQVPSSDRPPKCRIASTPSQSRLVASASARSQRTTSSPASAGAISSRSDSRSIGKDPRRRCRKTRPRLPAAPVIRTRCNAIRRRRPVPRRPRATAALSPGSCSRSPGRRCWRGRAASGRSRRCRRAARLRAARGSGECLSRRSSRGNEALAQAGDGRLIALRHRLQDCRRETWRHADRSRGEGLQAEGAGMRRHRPLADAAHHDRRIDRFQDGGEHGIPCRFGTNDRVFDCADRAVLDQCREVRRLDIALVLHIGDDGLP